VALTDKQVAALAVKHFGKTQLAGTMFTIAWFESGFNPNATGAVGEKGLLQIYPKAWPSLDKNYNLYDPDQNFRAGKTVVAVQGLGAWSTYNHRGSYTNPTWDQVRSRGMTAIFGTSTSLIDKILAGISIGTGRPNVADLPAVAGAVTDPAAAAFGAVIAPITAIGNAIQFLADPANWLRLATFVAGGFVLLLGVLFLIGSNKGVQKAAAFVPARRVVKVARKVAA
jgi:hypothetical protein